MKFEDFKILLVVVLLVGFIRVILIWEIVGILLIWQILMFDSLRGRTCLHYAAYYGHSDCLKAILSTARTSHVALSWYVSFAKLNFIC